MASGGCGLIYGAGGIIIGIAAIYVGIWDTPESQNWLYVVFGGLFIFWGWQLAADGIRWMRMIPADALRLSHNHFSLEGRDYPYSAVLGVKTERTTIRKRANFIPSGESQRIIVRLRLTDREVLMRAGVGPVFSLHGSQGAAEVASFLKRVGLLEWRAKQPNDFQSSENDL